MCEWINGCWVDRWIDGRRMNSVHYGSHEDDNRSLFLWGINSSSKMTHRNDAVKKCFSCDEYVTNFIACLHLFFFFILILECYYLKYWQRTVFLEKFFSQVKMTVWYTNRETKVNLFLSVVLQFILEVCIGNLSYCFCFSDLFLQLRNLQGCEVIDVL